MIVVRTIRASSRSVVGRMHPHTSLRAIGIGALLGALVLACGSTSDSDEDFGASRPYQSRLPAPLRPAASCEVLIDAPELIGATHVSEGTPVTYNSSPPTNGPHYFQWAQFQEFSAPLDDRYLVHSLEHGAVALLYKCDGADCAKTLEALRKIRASITTDPRCDSTTRVRVIIAPYPAMDVPIAAVAWGWIYKAQCLDSPTLTQFTNEHYARGPEDTCLAGRTF